MNHSLLYRVVQSAEGAQCTNSMWSALHSLGAFTHSLGALTATWIIAFSWCVDNRIQLVPLLPPPPGQSPGQPPSAIGLVPLLHLLPDLIVTLRDISVIFFPLSRCLSRPLVTRVVELERACSIFWVHPAAVR